MESLSLLGVIDHDMSEVFDFEILNDQIIMESMDPFMVQMPNRDSSASRDRSSSVSSSASWPTPESSPGSFFDTQSEADLQKSAQAMQDSPPSSVASSDFPVSPLSEGMETSYWQRNEEISFQLPAPKSDQDFVQSLLKPAKPGSTSTDSTPPRQQQSPVTPVQPRRCPRESSPAAASPVRAETRHANPDRSRSSSSKGVSLHDSSKVMQSNSKTVKSKGVKRKAEEIVEESNADNVADAALTRNEKNAIAARENRLKKKREVEDLKCQKESLESENVILRKDNSEHLKTIDALEEEVEYYKSLLFNHSALAGFLQSMNPCPTVKLSSSLGVSSKDRVPAASGMSGGVCIHVNGKDASLEFCSKCSLNANQSFKS